MPEGGRMRSGSPAASRSCRICGGAEILCSSPRSRPGAVQSTASRRLSTVISGTQRARSFPARSASA